jgi:Fic family protein
MQDADPQTWMARGEIQSKCEHLAGAPLKPGVAEQLHSLYLAKGIMATTAIEGNTLSEEEVERRIRGDLKLPPTKEYLGTETDNVLKAANSVLREVLRGNEQQLRLEDVKDYNALILHGLSVEEGVVPGKIRTHRVTVGRDRGAPAQDCEYLLDRLSSWLGGSDFQLQDGYEIVCGVIKAIVAHLYLAWIHPFGDGNGRTARLVEVRFLLRGRGANVGGTSVK